MRLCNFARGVAALAASALVSFSTAAVPEPPTMLQPAWVDGFSALLTWEESPGADFYNVYRFDPAGQGWVQVGANLLTPMFREAPVEHPPLQYAITAVNDEGEGAAASATIEQGGWADFMVMFYDPSWYPWLVTSTSVTLQLAASPVSGVDALLEFGTDPADLEFLEYRPEYAGFHSFTVGDLAPGTQYFFRLTVSGTNRLGLSVQNYVVTVPENQPPQAAPVAGETWEDIGPAFIAPNGFDPDGHTPLVTRVVTQPANGSAYFDGQMLVYTPAPNFFGTDVFTYAVHDGEAESEPATVTVTVHPINDAGMISTPGLRLTILEGETATGSLIVEDIENDSHWLEIFSWPSAGLVEFDGLSFVWTPPAPDFHGTAEFVLGARDANWNLADGFTAVQVEVLPVNDAPEASPLEATVEEDGNLPLILTASDVEGDTLSFSIVTEPEHGSLTGELPNVIYVPNPNYHGADTFAFTVSDGVAESQPAAVAITVVPVNDAPVAAGGTVVLEEDDSSPVMLTGTDSDEDALAYAILEAPVHGVLSGVPPNLIYTPAPNFHGADRIVFVLSDGQAQSDPAHIVITVLPVNDQPAAQASSVVLDEDASAILFLAGADTDGDALAYHVLQAPAHGTLSGSAPNLVYTPAPNFHGSDRVIFAVSDSEITSEPVQISITVNPVNDAPSAAPSSFATAYNTPVAVTLSGTDPDGNPLSFTVTSNPANGTLSGAAPNLLFTPNTGWSGTTSFQFTASDGIASSSAAAVTITVHPAAAPPAAPTALSARAVSRTQIDLSWSDNSGNEDGFKIERNSGSGYVQIAIVGPNVRTFSSTGLSSNKSYSYRVRAHNMRGNSAYSNNASARTLK